MEYKIPNYRNNDCRDFEETTSLTSLDESVSLDLKTTQPVLSASDSGSSGSGSSLTLSKVCSIVVMPFCLYLNFLCCYTEHLS